MASVASLASAPAPAARAQAKDRITSAAALPVVVKSLSPRNATQPNPALPAFNPDPMPIITEFYGPAKVESFSVSYDGKPVKGWAELIAACCVPPGTPRDKIDLPALTDNRMISSKLIRRVLRASDTVTLLHLPKTDANAALWTRLDDARFKLALSVCYCSVFDECWISDLRSTAQRAVKACPVDPVPYVE